MRWSIVDHIVQKKESVFLIISPKLLPIFVLSHNLITMFPLLLFTIFVSFSCVFLYTHTQQHTTRDTTTQHATTHHNASQHTQHAVERGTPVWNWPRPMHSGGALRCGFLLHCWMRVAGMGPRVSPVTAFFEPPTAQQCTVIVHLSLPLFFEPWR